MADVDANGQYEKLRDRMAKMRAAKVAKGNAKARERQGPPKVEPERIRVQLPPQYTYEHRQSPPTQRMVAGVLDVQINTDPDMQNVTLIVKGPAAKMRGLVKFAIEQSVPFLNDDAK